MCVRKLRVIYEQSLRLCLDVLYLEGLTTLRYVYLGYALFSKPGR